MLLLLVQHLLPELSWGQTAQVLLESAVVADDLVALSPEVAQGILGEEAAIYQMAGTGNLPADIQRATAEIQEEAARIQARQGSSQTGAGAESYWRPPPADQRWTREAAGFFRRNN